MVLITEMKMCIILKMAHPLSNSWSYYWVHASTLSDILYVRVPAVFIYTSIFFQVYSYAYSTTLYYVDWLCSSQSETSFQSMPGYVFHSMMYASCHFILCMQDRHHNRYDNMQVWFAFSVICSTPNNAITCTYAEFIIKNYLLCPAMDNQWNL